MRFNIIGLLLTLTCFSLIPGHKKGDQAQFEADSVYKMVYGHYFDILDSFYKLEEAQPKEKPYYHQKLIENIVISVKHEKFKLYGNCFSRAWRNITTYSAQTPLKKFDTTYLEDALGHLGKYQNKLFSKGVSNPKLDDLINSLKSIRHYVQTSMQYTCEMHTLEISNLHNQIYALKSENALLKSDLIRTQERLEKYEKCVQKAHTQIHIIT